MLSNEKAALIHKASLLWSFGLNSQSTWVSCDFPLLSQGWNTFPLFPFVEMSLSVHCVAIRWRPTAASSATQCAMNRSSARSQLTVNQTWFSRATASSWNTTLRPSLCRVSHKPSPWPSERCASLFSSAKLPVHCRQITCFLSPSPWLIVCVAAHWWAAVHSWAPADGSGGRVCLHDQGYLCRKHGWEQVWGEVPPSVHYSESGLLNLFDCLDCLKGPRTSFPNERDKKKNNLGFKP